MADHGVVLEGIGLHTGRTSRIVVACSTPGTGIRFVRTDLPGRPSVQAVRATVVSTDRHTVLASGEAVVMTVEHLMAALSGLSLWDAVIEVDGPEVPILDGSALPFVAVLASLEPSPRAPLIVASEVSIRRGGGVARVTPSDGFTLECSIEFDHLAVRRQTAVWDGSTRSFMEQVAPARTFGFLDEMVILRERGLAAGASLENALVFGPSGPVSPARFDDEPARHKLLDAIGDLALLGCPIRARVVLEKPGHSLIVGLVETLEST
jgi:UDP-3-O-[3-hydroxymyristoyl] N-acetylglucosamine deacetylase